DAAAVARHEHHPGPGGVRRIGAQQERRDLLAHGRDHLDLDRLAATRVGGEPRELPLPGSGEIEPAQLAQPFTPCCGRIGHAHPCSARGSETSWGPPSRRTSSSMRLPSAERSGYASRSSPVLLSKVFSRVRAPSLTSEASTVTVAQSCAG